MVCAHPQLPFTVHSVNTLPDAGYASRATLMFPQYVYDTAGERHDNLTDWGLKQFQSHYREGKSAKGSKAAKVIGKRDVFHYTYAVLHPPAWRQKYALNLKRTDLPLAADALNKPRLKADADSGTIVLDASTSLSGIPPAAWAYKLGNRSALEWVLDQYKESTPRDPTIAEHFNTYRFADYKEHVIDMLARVTTVSVETMRILHAMPDAAAAETPEPSV